MPENPRFYYGFRRLVEKSVKRVKGFLRGVSARNVLLMFYRWCFTTVAVKQDYRQNAGRVMTHNPSDK